MGPLQSTIATLTATVVATADISAKQFIGFNGAPAGDGDPVYGVSHYDTATGDAGAVDVICIVDMVAPAPIPAGSPVQSDANGAPVVRTAGVQIGTAITAAVNPGDLVKLLIK